MKKIGLATLLAVILTVGLVFAGDHTTKTPFIIFNDTSTGISGDKEALHIIVEGKNILTIHLADRRLEGSDGRTVGWLTLEEARKLHKIWDKN